MIGNPPYVVVKKEYFPNYRWNTDLYTIFFEVSLKKFLMQDGVLSFITPRFFLFNQNCFLLRKYFLEDVEILGMTECSPFDAVTENLISVVKKQIPKLDFISFYKHHNNSIIYHNILKKKFVTTNKFLEINSSLKIEVHQLLHKIENGKKTLSQIATSKRGAEIGKKNLKECVSGIPILLGYDVNKFHLEHTGAKIPSAHKEFLRLEKYFNTNHIVLLRRVSKNLISTVSIEKTAFSKNLYGIFSSEVSPFYLSALLNSRLLNFYYKKKFSTKKEDVFPEIQTYLYEQLPIAFGSAEDMKELVSIAYEIISSKKADHSEELFKNMENIIYRIYKLSDDEITIVNEF